MTLSLVNETRGQLGGPSVSAGAAYRCMSSIPATDNPPLTSSSPAQLIDLEM